MSIVNEYTLYNNVQLYDKYYIQITWSTEQPV